MRPAALGYGLCSYHLTSRTGVRNRFRSLPTKGVVDAPLPEVRSTLTRARDGMRASHLYYSHCHKMVISVSTSTKSEKMARFPVFGAPPPLRASGKNRRLAEKHHLWSLGISLTAEFCLLIAMASVEQGWAVLEKLKNGTYASEKQEQIAEALKRDIVVSSDDEDDTAPREGVFPGDGKGFPWLPSFYSYHHAGPPGPLISQLGVNPLIFEASTRLAVFREALHSPVFRRALC